MPTIRVSFETPIDLKDNFADEVTSSAEKIVASISDNIRRRWSPSDKSVYPQNTFPRSTGPRNLLPFASLVDDWGYRIEGNTIAISPKRGEHWHIHRKGAVILPKIQPVLVIRYDGMKIRAFKAVIPKRDPIPTLDEMKEVVVSQFVEKLKALGGRVG